jgi:hypothetical protein
MGYFFESIIDADGGFGCLEHVIEISDENGSFAD